MAAQMNRRTARHIDTHADWEMRATMTRVVCLLLGGAALIATLLCVTCGA